ncbi:hypothetical protein D3C75_1021970 [compost metagenome]
MAQLAAEVFQTYRTSASRMLSFQDGHAIFRHVCSGRSAFHEQAADCRGTGNGRPALQRVVKPCAGARHSQGLHRAPQPAQRDEVVQAEAVIRLPQQRLGINGTPVPAGSPFPGRCRRCAVGGREARSERHAAADLGLQFAALFGQECGQREQLTQSAGFGAEAQA